MIDFPAPRGGDKAGTIPRAMGLSAAYLCQSEGCNDGSCNYCAWLRQWGARCVCTDCGAPLEVHPWQFVTRPQCGDCAERSGLS